MSMLLMNRNYLFKGDKKMKSINDALITALAYFGGGSGSGGSGGVTAYTGLTHKPKVNDVEIINDKDMDDYIPSVTMKVPVSGWSASAVTIDGSSYFTNELVFSAIYSSHPDVNIDSDPAKTLPTAAERAAFGVVVDTGYIACDKANKKLIVYATEKPTSDFYIYVNGAKV